MKSNYLSKRSIRNRLLVLTSSLLLVVIIFFGLISYFGIRKAVLNTAKVRLEALSQQLGSMLSGSSDVLLAASVKAVSAPVIKNTLINNNPDSIARVVQIFRDMQKDSTYVEVQLLDSNFNTVTSIRKQNLSTVFSTDSLLSDLHTGKNKSAAIGNMFTVGDSIFYTIILPVQNINNTIGYVVKYRLLNTRPEAVEQLSALIGADAKLYIGNLKGNLWIDLIKPVSAPPLPESNEREIIEFDREGKTILSSIYPIASTPWQVSVEFEKRKIVQSANVFLFWLSIAGLVIFLIGMVLAWTLSRNISDPLVKLTIASTQIASGQFFTPVQVNRMDEVGKLARAFNAMAIKVRNSQINLEQKAEKYKLLFEKNPMPMWIILRSTAKIIDVNTAALKNYGYSKEEFLQLEIKDLSSADPGINQDSTCNENFSDLIQQKIFTHKRKNGTTFIVELTSDDFLYRGEQAILVVVNDITEKLKAEADLVRSKVQQQELITETTIQVQEKEREELGKELHDNINQILASAKLYLELIHEEDKSFYPAEISKIYHYVSIAINHIRQISKQLVPPSLDSTLEETLRDLTDEIESVSSLRITLDMDNFDEELPEEGLKLMIYRIVQEQINNIIKHASASDVRIQLKTESGILNLEISDNGVGFDTAKRSKGIGLRNIENRVKFQKGSMQIHSKPGNGCSIFVLVPLTKIMKRVV